MTMIRPLIAIRATARSKSRWPEVPNKCGRYRGEFWNGPIHVLRLVIHNAIGTEGAAPVESLLRASGGEDSRHA